MLSMSSSGSFAKTLQFLQKMQTQSTFDSDLHTYAQRGVEALRANTPMDSGLTAASWGYEIESRSGLTSIYWTNTNSTSGANVAILLQYGHGTGTGGYVTGRDFINPAIKPIFDEIQEAVWRKVTSA